MGNISSTILEIIHSLEFSDVVESKDFENFYNEISKNYGSFTVGELTAFFYAAGVNPLRYMKYIPERYLYNQDIESFNIPHYITEIKTRAFYRTKLKEIYIPSNIKIIGERAFESCNYLINVNIAEGLQDINSVAFYDCYKLEKVILPKSLKLIGSGIFSNGGMFNTNLKEIIYMGTIENFNNIKNIKDIGIENNTIIHCLDGKLKFDKRYKIFNNI